MSDTYRCPSCSSTNINQYQKPTGPMWCTYCHYRVENKEAPKNPFLNQERPVNLPPERKMDDFLTELKLLLKKYEADIAIETMKDGRTIEGIRVSVGNNTPALFVYEERLFKTDVLEWKDI
ncbi:MAG: hypothetical protein GY799_21120 [Desulfobulbaceae bacterium]|nr:hypothetical protein [Desulfobulbaceae bacterium]